MEPDQIKLMQEALISLYDAHIEASLTYDERRFTLIQYFLVGLAAIYAFWFNVKDHARKKVLFKPLIVSSVGITVFAIFLVFVYSKNSHEYFMYAEKGMKQIYDIVVSKEAMSRSWFPKRWGDVQAQFWSGKVFGVLVYWILPMVFYSTALSFAAFVEQRSKNDPASCEKSGKN